MASVIDAAMNRNEAMSSRSPLLELNQLLVSTQISTGMLKMRVNVMEFGRFTQTDRAAATIIVQRHRQSNPGK
jgi:hypothetical protein